MAMVCTLTLPHYDTYPVHVALFHSVTNADFLRSQLLAANPAFDYAFIDAAMILSPSHLLTATFLALHAHLSPTLSPKTHTPHSELLFRLSPTNNIGEAYRLFGISASTTRLVVVKLPIKADGSVDADVQRERVAAHLGEVVEGQSVELGEGGEGLGQYREVHRVKKVYKIACSKGKKAVVNGDKGDTRDIESVVLGSIALKGW